MSKLEDKTIDSSDRLVVVFDEARSLVPKDEDEAFGEEEAIEKELFSQEEDQEEFEVKPEDIDADKLGPKSHYRPQRAIKDKSVMSFMSR